MEVRFDETETVVIDLGSGFIKAGYSGEDLPRVVIPTVVGEKTQTVEDTSNGQNGETKPKITNEYGNRAFDYRDDHDLHYPIQRGIITDIDRLGLLLQHIFENELSVDSRSMNVLMTDCPLSKKEDKIKLATLMFEQFKVKSFALQNTAALSLFSTGATTGLVAEVGEGVTYTVPIFEGYALPHALYNIDVSGQEITNLLIDELKTETEGKVNQNIWDSIRRAKEEMCSVSLDYHEEINMREDPLSEEQRSYELPDNSIIQIPHHKRIKASECIFQPSFCGVEHPELGECYGGVANLAFHSIEKCDQDLKMSLYSNVVLAGGTTLLKRFPERFEYELKNLARGEAKTDIKIHQVLHRKNAAWVGGSMLASFNTFN